jgi:hypothetical protein
MTIKDMGPRLREVLAAGRAAEAQHGQVAPPSRPEPPAPYVPGVARPAPEAAAIADAEDAAAQARLYIEHAPAGAGGVAQAKATLAVAASIDALREALTDRLDLIADQISELKD